MNLILKYCACLLVINLVLQCVLCKPTVYQKKDPDSNKYLPVLIPISSTVIPLPIYHVGYSIGTDNGKPKPYHEDSKLITVKTKKYKKEQDKKGATVKVISREHFESDNPLA